MRYKRVKQAEAETLSIKLEKPIENVKDKEYLSFVQTGKLLGLSRQAVYNIVKAGNLKVSNALPCIAYFILYKNQSKYVIDKSAAFPNLFIQS